MPQPITGIAPALDASAQPAFIFSAIVPNIVFLVFLSISTPSAFFAATIPQYIVFKVVIRPNTVVIGVIIVFHNPPINPIVLLCAERFSAICASINNSSVLALPNS